MLKLVVLARAFQDRRNGNDRERLWPWRISWFLIVGLGLVLMALQSPTYIFDDPFDDALMVAMAHGFLNGHWASSWATTGAATLSKPVGYPLFLAGSHFLPWSPLLSCYTIYVVGASLIARGWLKLSASRVQATLLLGMLILSPVLFSIGNTRIYRDAFMDSLGTLAIGCAFSMAWHITRGGQRKRTDSWDRNAGGVDTSLATHVPHWWKVPSRRSVRVVGLAVVIGLAIGVAGITKPTWPVLGVALLGPLAPPVIARLRRDSRRLVFMIRVAAVVIVMIVCFGGVMIGTIAMDKHTYHVSLLEDVSSGALERTWKLWADVEAGPPRKYVPITRPMRLAVYRVSPTAAELEPYLESKADIWKAIDCQSQVHICNESGAWFDWDLLTAAVSTGRVHSVEGVQRFFNRIANDIQRGCASKKLRCSGSAVLTTGLPPVREIAIDAVASDTALGLWKMTWSQYQIGFPDGPVPTRAEYALWKSVVPDMPPISAAATGTSPAALYAVLRVIDRAYGFVNIVLLTIFGAGLVVWLIAAIRSLVPRKGRANRRLAFHYRTDYPYLTVMLSICAATVGMGTLAIFAVGQHPAYMLALYWTDFASVMELGLVLGAFASWATLWGISHRGSVRRGDSSLTAASRADEGRGEYPEHAQSAVAGSAAKSGDLGQRGW